MMLAQVYYTSGWSMAHNIRALIVLAAIVAIALIAIKAMGVTIPGWVMQIFWVVVICFIALLAIGFVLSM